MAGRNRRRDASGHIDPFLQRRRRYEAVLRVLGLGELFAALPRALRELYSKLKLPDPVLEFDAGAADPPGLRAMRREAEARFRAATVTIDGAAMPVRDFVAVVTGLKHAVERSPRGVAMPESVRRFLDEAGPRLDRFYAEHLNAALVALYNAVNPLLLAHSRLDTRQLTQRMDCGHTPAGKLAARVVVGEDGPQVRRVALDGEARPMFRAAAPSRGDGVRWLSWDAATLGREAAGDRAGGAKSDAGGAGRDAGGDGGGGWPVYVQSHALRQLHARVNLPGAAPYLEAWLAESLAEPRVVERQGEDLLVEYRILDARLGYLVATPLADCVAVRTFKFLTMDRTPEARMLERQLRLSRRDADWLGLHELAAFTQTDLKADPVLRPLLESCGCGHLFALAEKSPGADFAPPPKPLAAEMRRYLRVAA